MGPHSSPVRLYLLRARSIQPNFPEISVQNSMDRFGPTRKVSKKRVHLLRWSSFLVGPVWILIEWIAPCSRVLPEIIFIYRELGPRTCLTLSHMDSPKIPMPGADPANARQNYYNIPFNVFAFFRFSLDATIHVPQHQPAFLSYITLLFLRQTYGNP